DRTDEGYGLNMNAVEKIADMGVELIITVDCGTTSKEETEYCKDRGIPIVITDHHECGDVIPDTLVVNPKRRDSTYPFRGLSGAG
ncbi:MAG TPA: single-stranded-DNA-specific exonuclease RecJ, partial [Clostridiaceae bacterium]|nr:single-stranded-DNA-specific exonuclease RecJ [Clostridiaceae bacterium]